MVEQTTDLETCTICFIDESEQAKAFNYLIHCKTSISGADKNTIIINKSDCTLLKK